MCACVSPLSTAELNESGQILSFSHRGPYTRGRMEGRWKACVSISTKAKRCRETSNAFNECSVHFLTRLRMMTTHERLKINELRARSLIPVYSPHIDNNGSKAEEEAGLYLCCRRRGCTLYFALLNNMISVIYRQCRDKAIWAPSAGQNMERHHS